MGGNSIATALFELPNRKQPSRVCVCTVHGVHSALDEVDVGHVGCLRAGPLLTKRTAKLLEEGSE